MTHLNKFQRILNIQQMEEKKWTILEYFIKMRKKKRIIQGDLLVERIQEFQNKENISR